MYAPGFDVDPDALRGVASGVRTAVEGAGAQDLVGALGGATDFGHDGLHAALTGLVGLVAQGVRGLRDNAAALAEGVSAAAAQYADVEDGARLALIAPLLEGAL